MVGPTDSENEANAERRDAELRWQQAELRILELATTERTIVPILNAVTAAVDEALPDAASSILLVEDGGRLRYGSAPRLPASYNTAIDGLSIGPAQGSCGTAAYRREPVIVENTFTDPLWAGCRDLAREHGLRACWAVPVIVNGEVLATFAVYHREHKTPADWQQRLIQRVAGLVAIAMDRLRAIESVSSLEERFRQFSENVDHVFWFKEVETGRVLFVNEAYERVWGWSREDALQNGDAWLQHVHPDDLARVRALLVGTEPITDIEYRVIDGWGRIRWIHERYFPVRDERGEVYRIGGIVMDITERKQQLDAVQQSHRALRMLSACNAALVRAESRTELFQSVCDSVVSEGGYALAWVGVTRLGAGKALIPIACAGSPADGDGGDESWIVEAGPGPTTMAMREARTVYAEDLQLEWLPLGWRTVGAARGYGSAVCIPLCHEGKPFGVLALFRTVAGEFPDDEQALLGELADNLAYGIMTRRLQRRQQRLSEAVLSVASAVSEPGGTGFLQRLVDTATHTLNADIGFLVRFERDERQRWFAYSLAGVVDGERSAPLCYELTRSPSDTAWDEVYCSVPDAVVKHYPEDDLLHRFAARAYAGHRLDNSRGEPVGALFVLYRDARRVSSIVDSTLQIFAARAVAELEREDAESLTREQAALLERTRDAIALTDWDGTISYWNRGAENTYGWPADDVIGRSLIEVCGLDTAEFQRARATLESTGLWSGRLNKRRRDGTQLVVDSEWTATGAGGPRARILHVDEDVTQRKRDEARIQQLAFYDGPTGLPNRVLWSERLKRALAQARSLDVPATVLHIDVDRFKEVNDSFGHDIGDQALVQVARRLVDAVSDDVILARSAGDEFLAVVVDYDAASAAELAQRLHAALEDPVVVGDHRIALDASIGAALFPKHGDTPEALIQRADQAMRQAKQVGGGYQLYDPAIGAAAARRLTLARRFAEAVRADRGLELHYQPQVDMKTGALIGAEALLRWHDPEWGWVSPGQFIPIAEERRLMVELGDWVIWTVARQLDMWRRAGCEIPGAISINVGAQQLEDPSLVDRLCTALTAYESPASAVALELTETGIMTDAEHASIVLRRLKDAGFRVSIDDFGTGYSSLAYLKRFEADELKIDMSFVRDMLVDRNDHAIVETVIAVARTMGMETVAEGVESEGQWLALRALGCDRAQGFFFGRPIPAADFHAQWLVASAPA